MFVAGETINIFLLTGVLNINIFFIKKKNNVVVTSNIYDQFALKILTYNVKNININQHNRFPFERLEDVCPLPGAVQNHTLPLLLPPHFQIEDNLLDGGPCPTKRSGKNSSCGEACHTKAYCGC